MVTLIVNVDAQSPATGVNTYLVVPEDAVLIVEGFQVPLKPLFEVGGSTGASDSTHNVPMLLNFGVTGPFIPTFTVPDQNGMDNC